MVVRIIYRDGRGHPMNITIAPTNPIQVTIVEPEPQTLTVNAGDPVNLQIIQSLTTSGTVTVVGDENAERILKRIWNNTGSTLAKGTIVYVNGGHGSSDLTVALADKSNEPTASRTLGWVYEDIDNNDNGYVVTQGFLQGITTNTVTGNEGDLLWLGDDGGFQTEYPVSPDHSVFVGYLVKKAGKGIGSVYVQVQNGYELGEIHDVLINTPSDGQLLTYDGVTGLWRNVAPAGTIANLAYLNASQTFTGSNIFSGPVTFTSNIDGINTSDVINLDTTIASINTQLLDKSDVGHTHVIADISGLTTDLSNKAPLVHTHAIADVTGLQTALDGKALAAHTHPQSDITGLVTDLSNKSDVGHTHFQSEITNLVSDLAGKASTVHTHPISDVVNLQTELDSKVDLADNLTFTGTNTFTGPTIVTVGGLQSTYSTSLSTATTISGSLNLTTANITGLSSADISDWNDFDANPNSATTLRDDFICNVNETGEVGLLGWQFSGCTVSGIDAPSGRPGVFSLNRSSTTGVMYLGTSSVAGVAHTDDINYVCWIFRDNQVDTTSTRYVGLSDTPASPTKFIGFRKASGSSEWKADAFNSVPSGTTPVTAWTADTNYHKIEMTKLAANTWGMYADDTFITTFTSAQAPVGSLLPTVGLNGSTSISLNIDFFSMKIGATTR
jgi:hypothetical protein